jgi:hypothetical protein
MRLLRCAALQDARLGLDDAEERVHAGAADGGRVRGLAGRRLRRGAQQNGAQQCCQRRRMRSQSACAQTHACDAARTTSPAERDGQVKAAAPGAASSAAAASASRASCMRAIAAVGLCRDGRCCCCCCCCCCGAQGNGGVLQAPKGKKPRMWLRAVGTAALGARSARASRLMSAVARCLRRGAERSADGVLTRRLQRSLHCVRRAQPLPLSGPAARRSGWRWAWCPRTGCAARCAPSWPACRRRPARGCCRLRPRTPAQRPARTTRCPRRTGWRGQAAVTWHAWHAPRQQ